MLILRFMTQETDKIKAQILRYCSIEERSEKQVFEKAIKKGMSKRDVVNLIACLKQEGYLNEHRFAAIFATSKLHQNKWGPEKITWELLQHGVDRAVIHEALQTIHEDEFVQTAFKLIRKKIQQWKHLSEWEQEQKLKQFLHGKGYSMNIINQALNSVAE